MLTATTKTHPGKIRSNNEDFPMWDDAIAAFALADGMGGTRRGKQAVYDYLDAVAGQRRRGRGRGPIAGISSTWDAPVMLPSMRQPVVKLPVICS